MQYFNLSPYYQKLSISKLKKHFPSVDDKINSLEKMQNHEYSDKKIAATSLVHASALVHWPTDKTGILSNEKFEYLGDSFINCFIAGYSMSLLPDLSEGEYSKLRAQIVSESNLAAKSRALNLTSCLMVGKSQQKVISKNHDRILADGFEAITAALLLDAGYEAASDWLATVFKNDIYEFSKNIAEMDVKGSLQNWTQSHYGLVPDYQYTDCTTDQRFPEFEVSLFLGKKFIASARAKNKKDASLQVAAQALKMIQSGELK